MCWFLNRNFIIPTSLNKITKFGIFIEKINIFPVNSMNRPFSSLKSIKMDFGELHDHHIKAGREISIENNFSYPVIMTFISNKIQVVNVYYNIFIIGILSEK